MFKPMLKSMDNGFARKDEFFMTSFFAHIFLEVNIFQSAKRQKDKVFNGEERSAEYGKHCQER